MTANPDPDPLRAAGGRSGVPAILDPSSVVSALEAAEHDLRARTASEAKAAGRTRAEAEVEGPAQPLPNGFEVDPISSEFVRQAAAGRLASIERRAALSLREVERVIVERLHVMRHDREAIDDELAAAERVLSSAEAGVAAERLKPWVERNQEIEGDAVQAKRKVDALRQRRSHTLRELELLDQRAKAIGSLSGELPTRLEAATADLEHEADEAFRQGYLERRVELARERERRERKAHAIPRRRRSLRIVATVALAVVFVTAAIGTAAAVRGSEKGASETGAKNHSPAATGSITSNEEKENAR